MRAVVTGGAGFIGSHLCDRILEDKYNSVVILDSLRTGKITNINPGATFKCCNLTRIPEDVHSIDVVFHLAAQTSVQESIKDPVRTIDVNVLRTTNLLSWAVKHNIENFVYVSSAAVYGDTCSETPIDEEFPIDPISPYGISKYMGELVCEYYADTYGMNVSILRPFNVYGPRQDPNSEYSAVIPKFIGRVRKGEQPVIYGDGHQVRDFIHVSDVVDVMLLSVGKTGLYNVGTGRGTSVFELAQMITSMHGMEFMPIYRPKREGDIMFSVSNPDHMQKSLTFEPKTSLKDGLKII